MENRWKQMKVLGTKEETHGNNMVTTNFFKSEFDILLIDSMNGLNRQEIEDQVIDLYYNKKKTYREIQKTVRKSSRDIKAILRKVEPELSSLSTPSQAYKLYSEGRSPNEVAIILNIREPEATQFYREYWNLNNLNILNQIYEETKGNFSSLVELHRQMKTTGMNVAHVIRLLRVANNDLQSIEYRCQDLKREAASLEAHNRNAAKTFQQLTDKIVDVQNTFDHYSLLCTQQRSEMERLYHKKAQLEELIEYFRSNNAEYVKIKENVKQKVENNLTNPKKLLRLTLLALIESLRSDTSKFQVLYYQMSTETTTMPIALSQSQSLTPSYGSQNYSVSNMDEQYLSQDYNSPTSAFENFVLNEAERLYDKLLDDSLNKVSNKPNNSSLNVSPSIESLITGRFDFSPSSQKTYTYRKENEEHTFVI